jgi:hypothetical protein
MSRQGYGWDSQEHDNKLADPIKGREYSDHK